MDHPTVSLWVKMEPFIVGALQISPPSKFSMHYLRKMSTYVRMRSGEGYYPCLSWPMWRHIACGKLQLNKDLAWLYFELFDSLVERTSLEQFEWAEVMSNCSTEEELEKQRNKLSVDTLQFLLFLYIQQLNKVSLRTSLLGDEWPNPKSKSYSLTGESTNQIKNWNDNYHQEFVQNHLQDLLELLLDPDQLTASSHSTHSSLVSPEAVRALSFLIEGSVNKNRTVHRLHELALWQPLHARSGFSKISKAFCFSKLESWLRACLTENPFGTSACLKSGKKLAWAQQVEGTTKRAKIACSSHMVPSAHRMVVMSQVYKQTLAKSSDTLEDAHVRIHRCCESFIYLLSPLRSVTIEKCRNSTFVLGPVKTVIHLHSCDNVKLIAVCHRLSLSSTTSCTLHILTPTRPLILLGNQTLTFAPFHTHYPMLEDHMGRAGLATVPNYWDNPMLVCKENCDENVFRLLPPAEFYPFVVPFEMEGDTTEIPGGLPPVYQKALSQREQRVQIWQKTVKEAGLTKQQRKTFQVLVENKFNEWLVHTGRHQQLDSLVLPAAGAKQAAG
ncbi:TBCC domain-containing protein 1 isoform X2 [Varanus komodoensis]|uniref:TBCC domain-containing protein 1 n=1 Tax=Varanus komodoensis TaxID=61221 RepID=A0A8D2KVP0_VARKO|nr:TBCC domain-containing protein 1 isoform X2 [Varanus komodoensis]